MTNPRILPCGVSTSPTIKLACDAYLLLVLILCIFALLHDAMNLLEFIIIARAVIIHDAYSLRFYAITLLAVFDLLHDVVDHAQPEVQPKIVDVISAYPTLLYGALDPTTADLVSADAVADASHTIPFYALDLLLLPIVFFNSPCVQFPSNDLGFLFKVLVPRVIARAPQNVTQQFDEPLHVIYVPLLPPVCAILLLYGDHAQVYDAVQLLSAQPLLQCEDAQDAQALVCVCAPDLNFYADSTKSDHLQDHVHTGCEWHHDHTYFKYDKEESANGYKSDADFVYHRFHTSFHLDKRVSAGGYKSSLVASIHGYVFQWAYGIFQCQHECVDQNVICALAQDLALNGHGEVFRGSLSVIRFEDARAGGCVFLCNHSYLSQDHHCNHGYKSFLLSVDFDSFLLNADFYNFLLSGDCDNSLAKDSCDLPRYMILHNFDLLSMKGNFVKNLSRFDPCALHEQVMVDAVQLYGADSDTGGQFQSNR